MNELEYIHVKSHLKKPGYTFSLEKMMYIICYVFIVNTSKEQKETTHVFFVYPFQVILNILSYVRQLACLSSWLKDMITLEERDRLTSTLACRKFVFFLN